MIIKGEDLKVTLTLNQLFKTGLTAEEFLFLRLLEAGKGAYISVYTDYLGGNINKFIESVLELGYVDLKNKTISPKISTLKLTEKGKKAVLSGAADEDLDEWYEEWYSLWPKGVKTGGYYIRSGKLGTKVRLKNFIQKYPNFTKEIIIKATKRYLQEQSIQGYTHTKLAHYFIEKEGVSTLAAECENLDDLPETDTTNYGGEEL